MAATDKRSDAIKITTLALVTLPAVLLGVFVMITGHEPLARWGLQLAVWPISAFAAWLLRRFADRVPAYIWGILFLILQASTLFGHGSDGVRRWLDLGIISVNASMLVLPALLVVLCRVKKPYPFIIIAAAVMCFQPDLSQLAAFCAGALPIVWQHGTKRIWKTFITICCCILGGICLFIPADIPPAPYSEGILSMLGNISIIWMAVGWAALLMIPLFFGYGYYKQNSLPLLCLAIYYMVSILFVLKGSYPVPFMGFGLSPIAGYWLAYAVTVPGGA